MNSCFEGARGPLRVRSLIAPRTLVFAALSIPPAAVALDPAQAGPPTIENTLGMPFVRIPAGEFEMGSDEPAADLARSYPQYDLRRLQDLADESPRHRVRITQPFYLGRTEVTVGQFRRFLQLSGHVPESVADGTGGYGYRAQYDPAATARQDAFEGRDPRYSWRDPGFAQTDAHPVVNVTWNDAVAMARWLSEREGVVYRLPTEAEWEYACRAGSTTRYGTGDAPASLLGAAATFDLDTAARWPQWQSFALPGHDGYAFTAPVASFAPNAFGLFDLHGNVWEWVADWHADHYYAQSPTDDPPGPATGTVRVRRGGSWHTWALYSRCAYRNWNTPSTRYVLLGMRLVREVRKGER